jgi:hypothetical protein
VNKLIPSVGEKTYQLSVIKKERKMQTKLKKVASQTEEIQKMDLMKQ